MMETVSSNVKVPQNCALEQDLSKCTQLIYTTDLLSLTLHQQKSLNLTNMPYFFVSFKEKTMIMAEVAP